MFAVNAAELLVADLRFCRASWTECANKTAALYIPQLARLVRGRGEDLSAVRAPSQAVNETVVAAFLAEFHLPRRRFEVKVVHKIQLNSNKWKICTHCWYGLGSFAVKDMDFLIIGTGGEFGSIFWITNTLDNICVNFPIFKHRVGRAFEKRKRSALHSN